PAGSGAWPLRRAPGPGAHRSAARAPGRFLSSRSPGSGHAAGSPAGGHFVVGDLGSSRAPVSVRSPVSAVVSSSGATGRLDRTPEGGWQLGWVAKALHGGL